MLGLLAISTLAFAHPTTTVRCQTGAVAKSAHSLYRVSVPEGDAAIQASALASQLSKTVALYVYNPDPMQKYSLSCNSAEGLKRMLKEKTGWDLTVGDVVGGSMGKWGKEYIQHDYPRMYGRQLTSMLLPLQVTGNDINFSVPEGKYVPVNAVQAHTWSKPLVIPDFYLRFKFAISCKHATEKQFLGATALAIGAKFVETSKDYQFKFDPAEYRARCIGTLQNPGPFDERISQKDRNRALSREKLILEAFKHVSNEQVKACFERPNTHIDLDVPNSGPFAEAFLGAVEGYVKSMPMEDTNGTMTADYLSGFDRPYRVMFEPPFVCSMVLQIRNHGGTLLN